MDNILDTAETRALAKVEEIVLRRIEEYKDEKQRRQMQNAIRNLLQSGIRLMRMETERVIDEVSILSCTKPQC